MYERFKTDAGILHSICIKTFNVGGLSVLEYSRLDANPSLFQSVSATKNGHLCELMHCFMTDLTVAVMTCLRGAVAV
jgi:hypothetical protein